MVVHVYQRSAGGYLLFYSVSDFLMFFSLVCIAARKYGITVFGVCPMFDHVHMVLQAESMETIKRFISVVFSRYSMAFNATIKGKGHLFRKHFGRAVKKGDKAIRTTLSYLYNNPGEKMLCKAAEEYRWTFLAYAKSRNPFSEPLSKSCASRKLRRALDMIDYLSKNDLPPSYPWLKESFYGLCDKERQQLVDYIIVSYNCLDYQSLLSYYGNSYEQTCLAFASNQGSEYDIEEEYDRFSHRVYWSIPQKLILLGYDDVKSVLRLAENERVELLSTLSGICDATLLQLCKYLRIPRGT